MPQQKRQNEWCVCGQYLVGTPHKCQAKKQQKPALPIQQAIIDLRVAVENAMDAADEINESEVKLTKKQEKELMSLHGDVRMLVNKTAIASNDQGDWFDE